MSEWEGFLLGLLQGLTEFLPVSSSGHIELLRALLGIDTADNLAVAVAVHAATALSILTVFWRESWAIVRDTVTMRRESPFFRWGWLIILSMIPVGVVGLLWEDEIGMLFEGRTAWVGAMLVMTGILLWITSRIQPREHPLTIMGALWMGIAQTVAVIPGISRSGATISAGILGGYRKDEVAQFAFLMVLPPILGATLIKGIDLREHSAVWSSIKGPLLIAFATAYVSGVWACRWMIALVRRSKLIYFAYYCMAIGIVAIISTWL